MCLSSQDWSPTKNNIKRIRRKRKMAKNPFAKFIAPTSSSEEESSEENNDVIEQLQSIEDAFCNSHMDVRHHLQLNKKKRINDGELHSSSDNGNNDDSEDSSITSTTRRRHHLIQKKINDIKIVNWSNVTLDRVLGQGGFAWVFQVQINDNDDVGDADENDKSNEAYNSSSMDDDVNQKEASTTSATTTTSMTTYALKCLNCKKMTTSEEFVIAVRDLAYEAYFLGILNHENIIKLRGVSSVGIVNSYVEQQGDDEVDDNSSSSSPMGYYFIMDELHGTLYDLLVEWRKLDQRSQGKSILSSLFRSSKKQKRKNNNEMLQEENTESASSSLISLTSIMSLQDRIAYIAVSIANGMKYIHSKNIVLRDLKLENVGYDSQGNIKIFDFGLARPVRSQIQLVLPSRMMDKDNANVEVAGSWKYMPPETILQQPRSMIRDVLATDVYSFGIVLWEIVTLQFAYEKEYNNIDDYTNGDKKEKFFKDKVAIQGYRPSLKSIQSSLSSSSLRSKNSKALKQLIQDCWDTNIDIRPSFERIWLTLSSEVVVNNSNTNGFNSIKNPPQQEQQRRGIANAIAVSEESSSSTSKSSKSSSHASSSFLSRNNKHSSNDNNDSHNSSSQRTVVTIDSEYSSDSRRLLRPDLSPNQ